MALDLSPYTGELRKCAWTECPGVEMSAPIREHEWGFAHDVCEAAMNAPLPAITMLAGPVLARTDGAEALDRMVASIVGTLGLAYGAHFAREQFMADANLVRTGMGLRQRSSAEWEQAVNALGVRVVPPTAPSDSAGLPGYVAARTAEGHFEVLQLVGLRGGSSPAGSEGTYQPFLKATRLDSAKDAATAMNEAEQ